MSSCFLFWLISSINFIFFIFLSSGIILPICEIHRIESPNLLIKQYTHLIWVSIFLLEKSGFKEHAYANILLSLTDYLLSLFSFILFKIFPFSSSVKSLITPLLLQIWYLLSLLLILLRIISFLIQSRIIFLSIPNLVDIEWIDIYSFYSI